MVDMFLQTSVPGYRIVEELFVGEHVAVARAIREQDHQPVILKQLTEAYPDASTLSRFLFSYEVGNKFDHPNITKNLGWIGVRRQGEPSELLPQGAEAGKPTIVLEDQAGMDLFAYIKQCSEGRLPLDVFLDIAIQLAEALSVVHYQQVIHKDLHPGNILYSPITGLAQITDFGLASLLSREQPALQPPERIEGVLAYISPEQTGRMNRALDYRSDYYTLGCTFYHLLSGHPPFHAKDALGMVHAHIAKQQTPLPQVRPDIPAALSAIIDRLMNKTAEDRYQSALGLKKDLEKVRFALAQNKPVPEFPLGMEDISDRLQIPQKLYGREKEVERLLQGFFQAAGGKSRLLAIAGYSGIGKSALVYEVHKPIAAYSGFFCAGKFDQFQKNIPYSALQTALKGWIQNTLSLPEAKLQLIKTQLLDALGNNARVLIDFMPDFEWVLGELPAVAQLGADETQNRFHLVFQRFIKEITHEHPLVLFIDDIQWADRGTLNLLPLLMSEDRCRLLLLVAYRDNEVDENHPAMMALRQIENAPLTHTALERLTLEPLSKHEVANLLEDALHRPRPELQSLVQLVHAKTAGNPFFIGEFLKALYTDKLLNFDLQQQRWRWDIAAIDAKGITDNVVDLMLGKMAQLPEETQAIIQLAACVGSRFSLEMLAKIAEQPLATVTRCLWPALRDGLLLQDGGDWFLGLVQSQRDTPLMARSEGPVFSQFSPVSPQCRFLHDRMLQAAYQSMSDEKRQQTHLRVGRLLVKDLSTEALTDEQCFGIVEQFNNARPLMTDAVELHELMQLNLRAAKQAKAASVWEAAAGYAQNGIQLLPVDEWNSSYDSARDLYLIKAECEYLSGHPDIATKYYETLFAQLNDALLRAEICATRLVQSIGRGEWELADDYGVQGLSYLSMPIPTESELDNEIQKEQLLLMEYSKNGVVDVSGLPEMQDPKHLVAMQIYPNLYGSFYITGNVRVATYCIYKGCNLVISSGKSDLTAIQLAFYAAHLCRQREYLPAYQQGVYAKEIADSYPSCREIANCYSLLGGWIWHFHASYAESATLSMKGVQLGLENGELARAAISYCNALFPQVSKGDVLENLKIEASLAEDFLNRHNIFHPAAGIIHRFATALLAVTNHVEDNLEDSSFNIDLLNKLQHSFHRPYLFHYRCQLAFWRGNVKDALMWGRQTQSLESKFPVTSFVFDHYFFYALCLIQHNANWFEQDSLDFRICLDRLRVFSETYPPNFDQKYLLVLAEQSRMEGRSTKEICTLYRDAIKAAQEQGFLHLQALGSELFGRYWLAEGFDKLALPLIREALYLYRQWGCQVKINQLRGEFGDLLIGLEARKFFNASETLTRSAQQKDTLDMASVMKSAQLISSELQLSRLSARVLEVIMESAGGSSAALIVNMDGTAHLVAQVDENRQLTISDPPPRLEASSELPINIIRYVLNSNEMVNIGDVLTDRSFANDPYLLKHQPRSVLCIPVDYRDTTFGALYLENNLTQSAFTPDRLDVIKLLLAQAAISFDNAQLFKEVTELNQTLEKKVELRTSELNQAVRDLQLVNEELNAFSYSVSHDLRAPLRGIRGFSQMIMEDFPPHPDAEVGSLLSRIDRNGSKMQDLIEGLLELSRVQRRELVKEQINLSQMVKDLFVEMRQRFPDQSVESRFAPGCTVYGDRRMIYSAVENLINNAWKYSGKNPQAKVEFGVLSSTKGIPQGAGLVPESLPEDTPIYFVKDNGAGFDMGHADKLFGSFQRLHGEKEFAGTGVGLATVKRVFEKHGGYVWAHASKDEGASFYFALPSESD